MKIITTRWKALVSVAVFLWLFVWIAYSVSFEDKHKFLPAFVLGEEVDFNTHIRPIFNKKCIACHGGVKKSGGFSLLFEEEALEVNESGERAIVPGSVRKSELIKRIRHHDPELRMPLESDPLDEEEIDLLTRWINQGAKWKDHWAYIPPQPKEVPNISSPWIQNDIDRFVLAKLDREKLLPNPMADRFTLLRRISLDLSGLPPTLEETTAFLEDDSPEAYERVVDRLLASPAYGERWAAMWMDLARYADSKGYESDRHRSIWKYRDWLIRALNTNKPFDQFVTEQLAGDLLPTPTDELYIATAFHRNSMNNDEGGTDNEEFRVAALIDRVNTTWSVLQGTTMECVQCHSHPYDPIRHEDFYRSIAFFNQSADADIPSEAPVLIQYKEEEDEAKLDAIKKWVGEKTDSSVANSKVDYFEKLIRIGEPKIHPHYVEQIEKGLPVLGTSTFKVADSVYSRIKDLPLTGKDRLMLRYRADKSMGNMELRLDSKDGELIGTLPIERKFRTEYDKKEKKNKEYTLYQTVSFPVDPTVGKRDLYLVINGPEGSGCIIEWMVFHESLPGEGSDGYEEVASTLYDLLNSTKPKVTTPIMVDLPESHRRASHVFEKGNWLVRGKEVSPGVPEKWNSFESYPSNRLGLAQWLVSTDNPLSARVLVNRIWEQLFGLGIVETLEDFGSQGFAPTHPELLDWLALQFMHEHDWQLKPLIKQLVMSATYRQSSHMREDLETRDPNNYLLARGPRTRLTAEQVRDQALAVSGLLSSKMYGPSVMPEQPDGIWQVVYSGGEKWTTSKGEDKYRRALYTFWRRTSPYPSFITFDAPSREFCLPRRIDTNTPLQALVGLNDPVYLETSLFLAKRVLEGSQAGAAPADKLSLMYSFAMLRGIDPEKLEALEKLYAETQVYFDNDPEAICQFTGEEDKELAVLTVMANVIMNLDEFVMKS
ncbi:MAG: DUF1553 domain-containing protein [Lunatimonas sp.]|uniref:DUF1553 domain-containing protein n=1 Tax=Lunatimonas sp. TaxID=2060141 RepID=UPI00263BD9F4|nr:DUF1553 domain-containing protein [Lunatimonas sp.]MCC5938234.1 DUF1553 domain-containing protein [Lunatimonas sp.]